MKAVARKRGMICLRAAILFAGTVSYCHAQSNDEPAATITQVSQPSNYAATAKKIEATDQRLLEAENKLLSSLTASFEHNKEQKQPSQQAEIKDTAGAKAEESIDSQAERAMMNAQIPVKQPVEVKVQDTITQNDETSALKSANLQLKRDLAIANAQLSTLRSELDRTKSQLMTAETEISRLSSIVDAKNRSTLSQYQVKLPANNVPQKKNIEPDSFQERSAPQAISPSVTRVKESAPAGGSFDTRLPQSGQNLPVAIVTAPKAELRLGPGSNNSMLMSLNRGARLIVEARQGEWYRVFAPSGERAWVQTSAVAFGDAVNQMNDSSASKVSGFKADLEEEAFRKISRRTGVQE